MKRVNVTQKDIDVGVPNSAMFCPIAYAVKRACKTDICAVSPYQIDTRIRLFRTPVVAQAFIKEFDLNGAAKVKPFVFYMEQMA